MGGSKRKSDQPAEVVERAPLWRPVPCDRCDRTGWLHVTGLESGQVVRWAARCSCPNGARLAGHVPRLDDRYPESRGASQADLEIGAAFVVPADGRDDRSMQRKGVEYLRTVFRPGSPLASSLESWVERSGIMGEPPTDKQNLDSFPESVPERPF